ncbi:D-aspartate oxidase [Lingula anatina]|uniref:D-aspartate oxidase n=1 Tax=Lingula anatina TaxID=7574 RepID=A0A1S3H3Y9_LINAN|nr:D-aspartate oxidase [Lingula anatina]|eukprot:XP_013379854.1 D-aspartate oxidase [Lingula anatina]
MIRYFTHRSMVNIAVVGAGVIGLTSAVNIQARVPGAKITVIADRFDQQTTSNGAAGLFRPTAGSVKGTDPNVMQQWCEDAWEFYEETAGGKDAGIAGIQMTSGYQMSRKPLEPPLYKDYVYHFRDMTARELRLFGEDYIHGFFCTTVLIECRYFLPWLTKKIVDKGGSLERRTITSLGELPDKYDVVVNCTGLGSRSLVNDPHIVSARGQSIRVAAPWITHFVYDLDKEAHIIPCRENVFLGGVKQVGNYSRELDVKDSTEVFEKCCKLQPSLRSAKVLWEWTGLRPQREPPRLEKEELILDGRTIKVVHNYGQGSSGVSLSWGCAKHAAKLVEECLK